VISTISWSLFGVQGLLGGAFASAYQRIIISNSNDLVFNSQTTALNPGYQMLAAVISAGIGLGCGIVSGLIIVLVSSQKGS
jgi:predicted lysophospholipase L1 biosynthesis ABC-type transport system permease subunit